MTWAVRERAPTWYNDLGDAAQGMSTDRFSYLEFGEEEAPAPDRTLREDAPEPTPREIAAERLEDGTALAEVRVTDPRGYRLSEKAREDEEDGVVSLSSLAVPKPGAPPKLRVTEVFGARGAGAGEFGYPAGMAVDSGGVLFVADSYHHRLQRITPGGGVAVIGGRGVGRGQFGSPQGVATDEEDSFYVVEQGNGRVQKFTREGVLSLVFGKPGKGEGELNGPTALAVAPGSGDIFVADTGNSRIQRFSYEGRFLGVLGATSLYGPGLSSPQALAAAPGGGLYAADTGGGYVVGFDPLRRPARQIGGTRTRGGANEMIPLSLHQPRALALDPAGLLYVADGGEPDPITGETRGRVQCLSLADGSVLATLEKIGRSLGTLLRPGGLAVSPASGGGHARGDLYVADTMNHRILRFVWS